MQCRGSRPDLVLCFSSFFRILIISSLVTSSSKILMSPICSSCLSSSDNSTKWSVMSFILEAVSEISFANFFVIMRWVHFHLVFKFRVKNVYKAFVVKNRFAIQCARKCMFRTLAFFNRECLPKRFRIVSIIFVPKYLWSPYFFALCILLWHI